MSTIVIISGIGLAAVGIAGSLLTKNSKLITNIFSKVQLPEISKEALANAKYYRGGFETKMSRREASLILGISPHAHKNRVKDAHKRIMLLNHPDRGGSPYMASKINEAKDLMDKI
ncbi:hypothetical protein SNEBB_005397 [Seison nebaliae]|nr:hypothetical protein SNEBB_005397 [Seison nebaliae]